jgi:hypothetical protein
MTTRSYALPALALAAAGTVFLAGCASKSGGGASAPAAPPAAASAPAAPPPPPPTPGYADVLGAFEGGPQARQDLVGTTVALDLQRPGHRAPASQWVSADGDAVSFRCLAMDRGFRGGPVTAQIRAVHVYRKERIVELARCSADAAPEAGTPAPAPVAAAAPAPSSGGAGAIGAGKPGMDARGNVIDSSKVESGSGRTVKGLNGYEGEITGNPGPGSKFTRLQIGMSAYQVTQLIGPPSDQGVYMTGKAWIPFYFGGDRTRYEMVYRGQGRLIFAGGAIGDPGNNYLIWIIHNPNEPGSR